MPEMLEAIGSELWLVATGVGLLIGVASFAFARRTGPQAQQIRELTGALDDARADADGVREELARYRGRVADHFAGTSDKLRELTVQYRSVYDHLAAGANALCPEGFEQLEGGLAAALPEGVVEEELETDEALFSDAGPDLEADPEPQAPVDPPDVRERTTG